MKSLFKVLGISFATILVLSITIKRQTIFEHIYSVLSHATIPAQRVTENLFKDGMNSTQDYSKKLFSNSVPKVRDTVKSKVSAPVRKFSEAPAETILKEEKEELDELIKSHR